MNNPTKLSQKTIIETDLGMFQLVYKSSLDINKSLQESLKQKESAIKEISESFFALYNDPKAVKGWIDLNNLIQKYNDI